MEASDLPRNLMLSKAVKPSAKIVEIFPIGGTQSKSVEVL